MTEELQEFLQKNSADWGLPPDGKWRFWVYNNWQPQRSNLDVMWFHGAEEFPRVVTKLDRTPEARAREFENLSCVYSAVPTYVPKPLHFGRVDDFWALWMEGVPGRPLRTDRPVSRLPLVVEMLVSFHSSVQGRQNLAHSERYLRMVHEPFQSVMQFGDSPAVRGGCDRILRDIGEGWLDSLPVIRQHGDFYLDNVISFRGQPRIVDWETFGRVDLPFYDLVTFLVSLLVPGGEAPARIDSKLAGLTSASIKRYAAGLGLPLPDLKLLLPLILVNWFHLMWNDGRKKFITRMYSIIVHWFEHPDIWCQTFNLD